VIYSKYQTIRKQDIMNISKFTYYFILIFATFSFSAHSQDKIESDTIRLAPIDSLRKTGVTFQEQKKKPEITLSVDDAVRFLQNRTLPKYWKDIDDPLRLAIRQLVFKASNPPFDSAEIFIKKYPFDSLDVAWDKFYIWDTVKFKIPVITPPVSPVPVDTLAVSDSALAVIPADTTGISDLILPAKVSPALPSVSLKDTVVYVVADTLKEVTSDRPGFPFTYYDAPFQSDSIKAAISSLMSYVLARDSSIIYFTGLGNVVTPVRLNSRSGMMHRYWLRTDLEDSVTVWIGSQGRNTIGLYLENGISFSRPVRQGYNSAARIEVKEVDKSKLLDVKRIITKPQRWKYHSEAAFALNQASLTNWVKGGESNIATSIDITGYADYTNKPYNITSNHFGRIKYGLIASGDKGVRKNLDLLETNSKINHKAFGKFDFSGILLFKTQIAKGYNYPNDSVAVSRFMNPGILTVGAGLDYKPDKNTSINFSPVSYKGTYVPDKSIDQTKYGIAADRRSKNEFGASFMISNVYKPNSTVVVTNRLQLFTNYINNPQNIDIDWEMIVTAKLNWFTDVRLNTHLIFDDDTKTPTYDKDNKPVMGDDNQIKKTARIQFKELLGFSFIFRF